MKSIQTLTLLALATLFFSCKQDAKQTATTTPPVAPETTTPTTAQPESYLYVATVDKLNLRDQPNKAGKVLAQFAEGEIMEGTGQVSANKEEATLRGISWTEPYFEIKYPTPGQPTGWVYGGALFTIYIGQRTSSPDMGKLGQLNAHLKTLNTKQLESGKKAWDFVKTNFASTTGSTADAAFILLEKFLSRMEHEGEYYKLTEDFKWAESDYEAISNETFDTNKYPHTKKIAQNGFRLETGEGMIFPIVDIAKLAEFFVGKATPPMKAYIEQELLEQKDQAWSDGGIIISLEKLADRGAWWERFNRENPYFPLHSQTIESERWPRLVLVNGSDNSPTYDSESQLITEEYKKAWAYIQQKYPGTHLAASTKQIADLCAAEGWKRTKKVEDFQMKFVESYNQ